MKYSGLCRQWLYHAKIPQSSCLYIPGQIDYLKPFLLCKIVSLINGQLKLLKVLFKIPFKLVRE